MTIRQELDRAIALARLLVVPFALLEVGLVTERYPSGYEAAAWGLTAALAVGAVLLFLVGRAPEERPPAVGVAALAFDTAVVTGFALVYQFEPGTPIRQLFMLPLVEATIRYGLAGGVAMPFAIAPLLAVVEWWRAREFGPPGFNLGHVAFQFGIYILIGLIVGALVQRLRRETALTGQRALESERLRDELGRRVDLLDAANRCARALGSSLELDEAFAAFIRELRGLVPFDRVAIILAEEGIGRVMAAAGTGADEVFVPGAPISEGSVLDLVLQGRTVYRRDIEDTLYPEEPELLALGLHSRLSAPLLLGSRAIGMLSALRKQPNAFEPDEVELVTLLGRLVATAVQNIRVYESERRTVEELRRLSALRADFVSLVSHELRSPMAAVIGAAQTLQQRARELSPAQRQAFLAPIADETTRLADLIADVLDTSRIESGNLSYAFDEVDLGALVQESVAAAEIAQDEVRVEATVRPPLPHVRADAGRLRQVLANLIENAVKYSPEGGRVEVAAFSRNGQLHVEVRDEGPGIPLDRQRLIFEKFGRADADGRAKPGTGLGLFIARSIAEAHGGTVEVHSSPGRGAVFSLLLPAEPAPS